MHRKTEKIKAVMLGHSVADALGVPVEFRSRKELDRDPVTGMRGFGTYHLPAGTWSDDTSMALCTLDVIAEGEYDLGRVMENFEKWMHGGEYTPAGKTFDYGTTCAIAVGEYLEGTAPESCGGTDERSNGNGSLMRIHPASLMLGLSDDGRTFAEKMEMIDRLSALTHGHERSKLACRIFTLILWELLEDPSHEAVGRALGKARKLFASSREIGAYGRLFSPDFAKLPREKIRSSGYVVDTLEAAVWCLLTSGDYPECVLKAVNLGEDTDTVAAVAGALAGARWGLSSIPKEWLDTLLRREWIEEMCARAGRTAGK